MCVGERDRENLDKADDTQKDENDNYKLVRSHEKMRRLIVKVG